MDHLKEAPDYLQDDHLSRGTKAYLKVLNGGAPVESLPVGEARRVLTDVQAAVHVDLSGIEESERTVESEGYTLRLNLVRPSGAGRVHLPAFVFKMCIRDSLDRADLAFDQVAVDVDVAGTAFGVETERDGDLVEQPDDCVLVDDARPDRTVSVSYTHLDVYKRQL